MRYRIWDKELIKYCEWYIIVDKNGIIKNVTNLHFLDDKQDRFIVELSTGLFDKNGKEIYEGDVCLFGEVSPIKDSVVYDNREAMFGLKGTSDILQQFVEGTKYPLEDKRAEVHIEVIGNIHEKEVE